jgi:hypothetical protein
MSKKTLQPKKSPTKRSKKEPSIDLVIDPAITEIVEKILQNPDPVIETVVESTSTAIPRRKKKPSEKPHYVNGKEFEDAIREFYRTDIITNYLAESLKKIASGLSFAGNFINYSYKDEMIGDAIVKMYQALKYKKFKLDHGFKPFSYFTTIAFHAFISRIKKEKKHHQLIEEYRDRQYGIMINADEDMRSHKVYVKPGHSDGASYHDDY